MSPPRDSRKDRSGAGRRLEAEQPDPALQTEDRPSRTRVAMIAAAILLIVGVVFYALTQGEQTSTARAPAASSPPASASNAAPSSAGAGQSSPQAGTDSGRETTGQGSAIGPGANQGGSPSTKQGASSNQRPPAQQ
jgi:hypothetical protein